MWVVGRTVRRVVMLALDDGSRGTGRFVRAGRGHGASTCAGTFEGVGPLDGAVLVQRPLDVVDDARR